MNHNEGKVKWVVIIGQPILSHRAWIGKNPVWKDQVVRFPGGGVRHFGSNKEAEEWIKARTNLQYKHQLRAEKSIYLRKEE